MDHDTSLPVHRRPDTLPSFQRHHSARYFAHRVKESLTTRVSKFICTVFLFILFVLGLITFILWLSLRPHRPRFHVMGFEVTGLAQPSGLQQAQIIFNFTIRNSNQKVVVHYDSIDAAVYYKDQKLGGEVLVSQPFDQEAKNSTVISGVFGGAMLTVNSERWMQFMQDRAAGSVLLRFEINSVIKFEIFSWDSRRHRMHANCDVAVGPDGVILPSFRDKRCPVYFT